MSASFIKCLERTKLFTPHSLLLNTKWLVVYSSQLVNTTNSTLIMLAVREWKCAVIDENFVRRNYSQFLSGRLLWNNNNTFTRSHQRHLSCLTVTCRNYDKGRGSNNDEGGGDQKDNSNDDKVKTEQEKKAYDPKEDSFFTRDAAFGSRENKGSGVAERPVFIPDENDKSEEEDLSAPTNCCQSGCPNCVWLEYAEKLSKKFTDPKMSRERVLKELESVEDQNIKAFIMMELRTKKII